MKVLIIERDKVLLETMRDICVDEGFEVVLCTDLDQARIVLNLKPEPDIIFCDQFLPSNSVAEFRRELLSQKDIRFILMKSMRLAAEKKTPHELLKPFSIEELLEILRQVKPS